MERSFGRFLKWPPAFARGQSPKRQPLAMAVLTGGGPYEHRFCLMGVTAQVATN
jgi:hypothetical protein